MDLKKFAGEAPREPGVYIMRDTDSRIIYVGKARILRNRLSSYFSGEKDIKTKTLLLNTASIETIIVKDEYEALLLENTLIKQHNPKYNINLKDGKTYPVIRLTSGPFPRVFKTRYIVEDGSLYYGPFTHVKVMDNMLDIIDKIFPLRKCKKPGHVFTKTRKKNPCMYYHIERCSAPCCGKTSAGAYSLQVDRIKKLLSGETSLLVSDLALEMKNEATALRFEKAARLRNAIKTIEGLQESNSVVDFDIQGRDYIAWAAEGLFAAFSVFSMRDGKLTGQDLYRTRSAADERESLEQFITSYYSNDRLPPAQIYLQYFDEMNRENNVLDNWFKAEFNLEPALLTPAEKHHAAILAMVRQNAVEELRRGLRERGNGPALDELKKSLGLKNRPLRIEGFDISHLNGKHPTASLVSFFEGRPDKKNYRYYKLRSVVGIIDDYAAIREVVKRRYKRFQIPDLILIDGGIGQVNAAKGVLDDLGLDYSLAGLAKQEEEIWLPGARKPLRLSRNSEALKLLQFVRDETHRFATALNNKLRSADLRLGILESVEGIGPVRAAELIRHYGSIEEIAAAEPDDITQVSGCGSAAARAVRAAAKLALTEGTASYNRIAADSEQKYT
ncbi:MAG: excinuclease ABC subunit UvrC [Treponema sp.]|jgi:excinuclease ABC subunit C|nr:excinuclease ABC subunit UvrC [Treponema sp.]